jgi:hypothetical protein
MMLNKVEDNEVMELAAVFSPSFDGTRYRFEIDKTHYIEGTLVYRNDKTWSITGITSMPPELYQGEIVTVPEGGAKTLSFNFAIKGKGFVEGKKGTVYRIIDSGRGPTPLVDEDTQLTVQGKNPLGTVSGRKSVVVYFLLDDSRSMSNEKKKAIGDSLINSIQYFKVGNSYP